MKTTKQKFASVGALAPLAQGGNKPAQTHTVLIKAFAFVPDHLTVSAGDTVVWKNEDIVPHTATAGHRLDSKNFNTGQSWLDPYTCTYHPTMHAELTVQ
jgi:plastocyanin